MEPVMRGFLTQPASTLSFSLSLSFFQVIYSLHLGKTCPID